MTEKQAVESQPGRCRIPVLAMAALMLASVMFILLYIVPQYETMFREMDILDTLPSITLVLISVSCWMRRLWFILLPAAGGGLFLLSRVPRRKEWCVLLGTVLFGAIAVTLIAIALFTPRIHVFGPQ